jgi:TonB-dependent SusC/RagA subfamily outer membrane receptor
MKTKIKFSVAILSLLLSINGLNAQNVKGKIVDKNGDPIPGAFISYGENQGTSADEKGEFTVNPDEVGKQLSVNFLGYKTKQVKLNNKSKDLTIQLDEDLKHLDQLVVIGYGKSSREKLTGSVTTITADVLAQSSGSSLLEALQGRVPGLYITQDSGLPGAQASISIRGVHTFTATLGHGCCGGSSNDPTFSEPLVVVDGVPFQTKSISAVGLGSVKEISPLVTLNTNDVERVDVLKDADATAIYGTRGSNGVILITTKSFNSQEVALD